MAGRARATDIWVELSWSFVQSCRFEGSKLAVSLGYAFDLDSNVSTIPSRSIVLPRADISPSFETVEEAYIT